MIWLLASQSLSQRLVRTVLTALGIAVAVGSMVIFLSLGEGLRQVFADQLGAIGPDLQVSYGEFDATASLSWVPELPLTYKDELEANAAEFGIRSVVPLLFHLRAGLAVTSSFLFQGVPPEVDIERLYHDFALEAGRLLTPEDGDVAVIGQQVAQRNQLGLGDTLRINRDTAYEIVGIARSGSGLIDNVILVPLESLQAAIGVSDKVMFLALELDDPAQARSVAERLSARYPELGFQTRGDVFDVAERGLQISDVVRLGISAIALIVGAIAVANTMMMSIFERTREFGVVRAIGARPSFLFRLVLLEAVLLSVVGAVAGIILGRVGMAIVNQVANDLIGLSVAALTLRLVLFAVAVAFAMGLLSGLVPALRASRIPIAAAMARE
jgi:putative ABC transport system permease protein